jgi:uncharacterized membrane protein
MNTVIKNRCIYSNLNFISLLMHLLIVLTKKITLNIFKIKIYQDLKSKFKKILYCYLNILYVVKEKINKNDKFM